MITLTPDFTVVDFQATPSGYYLISFRNASGQTITSEQTGRGGCNMFSPPYGPLRDELDRWLADNAAIAIRYLIAAEFPELADVILRKENEWQDCVVMSIADLIEMKQIRIQG